MLRIPSRLGITLNCLHSLSTNPHNEEAGRTIYSHRYFTVLREHSSKAMTQTASTRILCPTLGSFSLP